ncbi:hypothetical protein DPMN_053501 [Dreissena polymorpha]|uniref:Uncharacterized protein n=1 Tax=Dreissena polymorpha TaxID=45954 RepID=A0A9D4CM76_DREPO|nr:hypothetical protein DPMN_053501 [Dreissena polymorpha]
MLRPRIMKLHRYIDHDSKMTPIDFQVTRSKVKVTVTKNIFTQWLSLQLRAPNKLTFKASEKRKVHW